MMKRYRLFKRVVICIIAFVTISVLFLYGALFWPLPIERTIKVEISPDQKRVATYSWRPCGVIGFFTRDNPWVYLTVRDKQSGRIIARYSCWADVPEEAEERLESRKPW